MIFDGFKFFPTNTFLSFNFVPSIQLVVNTFIDDKCFSLNVLWDLLIANKNLEAYVSNSTIIHIGDINALNQFKK